ncbi:MAG TPA: 3' terminal RNA ribose 2'-O-methyltransferase Hen1 [Phycisphaerae bacterium]|nr:3' terminal RNA ribose 2'-O-methyltransferase Hen1 [Phycisphaerae bacterium]
MLLSITTTHRPAYDLGYLLHKNPARAQSFDLSFGQAHIFYPEASENICTVALLLDIDPIALVRNRRGPSGEGRTLEQYVNDRPYVASSFLSVAIAQVFGSALGGRSKDRAELVEQILPLTVRIATLPCRGGETFLRKLFDPLGYTISTEAHALDPMFPTWGNSRYYTVTMQAQKRLQDLLSHLYVLIPVLDDDKHYWVGQDEVEKLLRHGEGWLGSHPEREQIVSRYLKRQKNLTRQALDQLLEEDQTDPDSVQEEHRIEEAIVEEKFSLNEQRLGAVLAVLKNSGAKRILDLGCGEGKLLRLLLAERQFEQILGMDVSYRVLEIARDRLHLDSMPDKQRMRINLIHGSLNYRDKRLEGFDAASVVEVIEHLDSPRLAAFERVLFEFAKPKTIVLTTPNREYNVKWENLSAGQFRHKDHRFEWIRSEFQAWANGVCQRFGYNVEFLPIGPEDPKVGPPTQMGVFRRD